jgi:hypothetical protein
MRLDHPIHPPATRPLSHRLMILAGSDLKGGAVPFATQARNHGLFMATARQWCRGLYKPFPFSQGVSARNQFDVGLMAQCSSQQTAAGQATPENLSHCNTSRQVSRTNMDRSCAATILSKVGQALHSGGLAYRRKVRPFFTPASVFKGGGVAVPEQVCGVESV